MNIEYVDKEIQTSSSVHYLILDYNYDQLYHIFMPISGIWSFAQEY